MQEATDIQEIKKKTTHHKQINNKAILLQNFHKYNKSFSLIFMDFTSFHISACRVFVNLTNYEQDIYSLWNYWITGYFNKTKKNWNNVRSLAAKEKRKKLHECKICHAKMEIWFLEVYALNVLMLVSKKIRIYKLHRTKFIWNHHQIPQWNQL